MITDVAPRRMPAATLAWGAEWYSGAGDRYVMSSRKPNRILIPAISGSGSVGWRFGSGRRMPLGWPVVPDE